MIPPNMILPRPSKKIGALPPIVLAGKGNLSKAYISDKPRVLCRDGIGINSQGVFNPLSQG